MFCKIDDAEELMDEKKIKVVWICHFSNPDTRNIIRIEKTYYKKILCSLFHRPCKVWNDFAIWNTNAIKQFEKFSDIDLTVVFPYPGISGKVQKQECRGIHYVAFRSEDDHFLSFLKSKLHIEKKGTYCKNRRIIASIIRETHPDIVHTIGAENPYYSIAALDIPDEIPSIVSLQTLMSDPDFFANYPISKASYEYRAGIEKQVIRNSQYIGSRVERLRSIIWEQIKKDAVFLNISLAVGVEIDDSPCDKEYDFVYFAADISKACDYAIEAFAIACERHPGLTLNVSGNYAPDYKEQIDKRLRELGIQGQVFFTGSKSTHRDVIKQIKKSRFAILPLKVDLVSGTIREAMASGLPVITTVTPATPDLNIERESVLLSQKGDFQTMAENMLRLLDDREFATTIRENAIRTVRDIYSNERNMQLWRQAYHEIYENIKNGTPVSLEIKSN